MGTHPCMSGGPCQCGGNCGCAARKLEAVWFGKEAARVPKRVEVRWDLGKGQPEYGDKDFKKALRKLRLPDRVKVPQHRIDMWEEYDQDNDVIDQWLDDEYGYTHAGWKIVGSDVTAAWSMTEREYDALKKGQRVEVDFSGGMSSGKVVLEVGRTSYSKKYDVYSKKLHYIDETTNKPITKGKVVFTLFKRMSYRGEVYEEPRISLAKGDMGVQVKSFRKKGSEIKTAADIKKTIAKVFFSMEPHVKKWRVFLSDMAGELTSWAGGGTRAIPLKSRLKSINVKTSEEVIFSREISSGSYYEPPDWEEITATVPTGFDYHIIHTADLRNFAPYIAKEMRSNIKDPAAFVATLSGLMGNSNVVNMMGKIMVATVKNYAKSGDDGEFLSETDHEGLWREITDHLSDSIDGPITGPKDWWEWDIEKPKLKKLYYKVSGAGIEIHLVGSVDLAEADNLYEYDEPEPDVWEDEDEYGQRYVTDGRRRLYRGAGLGYDAKA